MLSVSSTSRAALRAGAAIAALAGTAAASTMDLGPAVIIMVTPPQAINPGQQQDDPITQPARPAAAPVSFSVMLSAAPWSGPRTISALSLSSTNPAPLPKPESEQPSDGAVNHAGQKVTAAPVRYVNDFETGEVGPEWGSFGLPIAHEKLTTFVSPAVEGGMVLNVKTETEAPYEIRLDVYLIPPPNSDILAGEGDDLNEPADNKLSILIDGQPVIDFTPKSLRKMQGERPRAGEPLVRKVRVPFNSAYQITEIRFQHAGTGAGWSSWGMDNLIIDLGLQDPVFGIVGEGDFFEPGMLGMVGAGAGMTGEIPGPPGNRYAYNAPFQGGPDARPSPPSFPLPPTEPEEETDDPEDPEPGDDDPPSEEPPPIPSPPTTILFIAAVAVTLRRRR